MLPTGDSGHPTGEKATSDGRLKREKKGRGGRNMGGRRKEERENNCVRKFWGLWDLYRFLLWA